MRSEGAAPGPTAPLCGALSLVLGALLGRGKLDLQDVLQGRAKVLAHTQGHKVADSSSSPSEDFSYKDKFLDAGPGSCKRLLNQDLMEKENFSSMAHSHLPSSLANNPLESATSTEKKRVLNVYCQPVPMKRGTASLGDTEDDLEPPTKMTRIARMTFPEKIPSKASLSSVCLRDVLTDSENGLPGEGQEEREEAENLARDSVLEDL